jgi:hypothetical protein
VLTANPDVVMVMVIARADVLHRLEELLPFGRR